ncbi:MAG: hypothetical protein QOJ17_5630 [Rhodospirillaceae bacterium]|jgi:hypothetical protein|nr:hypothetical protein [Rhodospirillaceae bacterium]
MRRAAQANWSRLPNHNPPHFYTAWVIRVILTVRRSLPVCPHLRTFKTGDQRAFPTTPACHRASV